MALWTLHTDGTVRDPLGQVQGRVATSVPLCKVQGVRPAEVTVPVRTPEALAAQVRALAELPQPKQRSDDWHRQRSTRITASEVGAVLGECAYEKPLDILFRKLGLVTAFSGNAFTAWGQRYEPIAQRLYTHKTGRPVQEFGLIPHPTIPFLGASPDGITPEGRMLEIKCPSRRVIDGVVPRHYYLQMQLQMEVCDLDVCDFLECRFAEYVDEAEYLADCTEDGCSKTSGLPNGVLVAGPNGSHEYPETLEAARDLPGNLVFWRLEQWSMVEVKRDRQWFQDALPRLEAFWKDVCYYRIMGVEHVRDRVPGGKKYCDVRRRLGMELTPAARATTLPFLSDSDSEDESAWVVEAPPGDEDDDIEVVFS